MVGVRDRPTFSRAAGPASIHWIIRGLGNSAGERKRNGRVELRVYRQTKEGSE
jgi:hypothetical protein